MSLLYRARETALGHAATVSGFARGVVRPPPEPSGEPWRTTIEDRDLGPLPITGHLANGGAPSVVVIVHGMGGSIVSPYAVRMARAAVARGHAALRMNLRGASGDGADLYHAGLGDDLAQVTRAPELARFEHVAIVGFSLGGHVSLRHAADGPHDPRLRAVVAVCPPVDLDRGTRAIQRLDRRPYQEFVLRSLRQQLVQVSARRGLPRVDPESIRTIRAWDERVICPRFGFESLEAFYRDQAAGPRLGRVEVPTLMLVADRDPMIAIDTVEPWLAHASDAVSVVRTRHGGHVAFPFGLGLVTPRGETIEDEIIRWIEPRLRA